MNIITKHYFLTNLTKATTTMSLPLISASSTNNSLINARQIFPPNKDITSRSYVTNFNQYKELYGESCDNPQNFWQNVAKEFYWKREANLSKNFDYNFDIRKGPIFVKWMMGAKTNICYNLIDRHVAAGRGDSIAFYWEGNHPNDSKSITYNELLQKVSQFSNVLKAHGVRKGDRVSIYMPMILELPIAMLACARIGAIHSVVFAGFSSDSLAERIHDCQAKILITSDGVWRGAKPLHLKSICDEALSKVDHMGHSVYKCIVVSHLKRITPGDLKQCMPDTKWNEDRDLCWDKEMQMATTNCPPEWVDAEDPLFMLYTSGSTGKPKGVLHTTAGYMLYSSLTFKLAFNYNLGDVFWSSADFGWVSGHTYGLYGTLANCATTVIFEGVPFYPDVDRFWQIIDKYQVNQFYTAPTAIRALMKFGDEPILRHKLSSLKVLGTVGEPINPEAWLWYYKMIGKGRCSVVDTYWQTETGGLIISPLPGVTPLKPGSAAFPFFGVEPILLDENGNEIYGEGEGYLVFNRPWPGIMRTLYNNHERFESTYFARFPGYYCTGDGARRDSDGYLWITGRVDDMLNVSGHLIPTSEIEAKLTEHPNVAEAAAVACPHPVKGQCLYCYVTLHENQQFNQSTIDELKKLIRERIGPFAQPDYIQHAPGLPKTRSGKIMRRILRKVAVNDKAVGDISTLAEEGIVEELFRNRPKDAPGSLATDKLKSHL